MNFKTEAKRLHEMIESASKEKQIVFVSHSFGDYVLSTYFSLYPPSQRVVGIISIGGVTIRGFPFIKQLLPSLY